VELLDDGTGNVGAVCVERNELRAGTDGYLNAHGTGEFFTLPAGMVLRSVGYKGVPLADVPYNERTGTINNVEGRVADRLTGKVIPGEYVVGWAKRGPVGVIGTNKADASDTIDALLSDLPNLAVKPLLEPTAIDALLQAREVTYVSIDGWRILDQIETSRGSDRGRPRVKFTRISDMLDAIQEASQPDVVN
jgi:ferredoxin--NADP+ reductase